MGKARKKDKFKYSKLKIAGENAGLRCPTQNHYYWNLCKSLPKSQAVSRWAGHKGIKKTEDAS